MGFAIADDKLDEVAAAAHRILCGKSLIDYVRDCYPDFELSTWQAFLCERLQAFVEAIERQESPRLMVHVPPQCGKTTIVSRAFIAWIAGRHPEWSGLMASYAASLSRKNSRWVRNRLRSKEHQAIFPGMRLMDGSQAVEDMDMERQRADGSWCQTGQIVSRGVGAGASGNPAMWVVVDDPFADRAAAESQTIRDGVEDWYSGTAMARLGPGAGVLIMHTRWHPDDLAGRLLAKEEAAREDDENADRWEVISFPAEYTGKEPADFYHIDTKTGKRRWLKARLRPKDFAKKKANSSERDWASLYQQSPTVAGGNLFKANWLRYGEPPTLTKVIQAWDIAGTEEGVSAKDYSAGVTMGIDHLGRYWLLEVIRGHWDAGELAERMLDFAEKWKPMVVWYEGGPGVFVYPLIEMRRRERKQNVYFEKTSHAKGDKVSKAQSAIGVASTGNLYLPTGALWRMDFVNELTGFPGYKTDDQVDALAIACANILRWGKNEQAEARPTEAFAHRPGQPIGISADGLARARREQERKRAMESKRR
jgi:predicted phage terminase large subunit-like protein